MQPLSLQACHSLTVIGDEEVLWFVRLLPPVGLRRRRLGAPPPAAAAAGVAHGHRLHVRVPHVVYGGRAHQPQLAPGKTALLGGKSEIVDNNSQQLRKVACTSLPCLGLSTRP